MSPLAIDKPPPGRSTTSWQIDVDRLAGLLAAALRLGVRDLPGHLRQLGVAAGPELLVLKALIGSGQVRRGQSSHDGAGMVEGGDVVPLAVNFADAARMLGVSESTIKRLVSAGELHAINVAGARRITQLELEGFVSKQMSPPEPSTPEYPDKEKP